MTGNLQIQTNFFPFRLTQVSWRGDRVLPSNAQSYRALGTSQTLTPPWRNTRKGGQFGEGGASSAHNTGWAPQGRVPCPPCLPSRGPAGSSAHPDKAELVVRLHLPLRVKSQVLFFNIYCKYLHWLWVPGHQPFCEERQGLPLGGQRPVPAGSGWFQPRTPPSPSASPEAPQGKRV